MVKYKAYNQLYHRGKPTGRKFVFASVTSKEKAVSQTKKANADFNKLSKKEGEGYSVKFVGVKKVGSSKPKRTKSFGLFN